MEPLQQQQQQQQKQQQPDTQTEVHAQAALPGQVVFKISVDANFVIQPSVDVEISQPRLPRQPSQASQPSQQNQLVNNHNEEPTLAHSVMVVVEDVIENMGKNLTSNLEMQPVIVASGNPLLTAYSSASPPEMELKQDMWIFYEPFWQRKVLVVFFSAMVLIWSFAWLYLGSTWDPLSKTRNLQVAVLNCDLGASQAVVDTFPATLQTAYVSQFTTQPLATKLLSASIYNSSSAASVALFWRPFTCGAGCSTVPAEEAACRQQLVNEIMDGKYWAGFFLSSNFTASHLSSFNNASALLGPGGQHLSTELIITRGRNYSTFTYLTVIFNSVVTGISTAFGLGLAVSGLVGSAGNQLAATALVMPVSVVVTDYAPVAFFGQNLATYVLVLLTWLGSAFVVSASAQHKLPAEVKALNATCVEERPPLWDLVLAVMFKAACCMLFTFILEVLLVCVVLALGRTEEDMMSSAGYAIAFLWYLSWSNISVNALLLHVMGIERFNSMSAFFLILQLMSSGGIVSEELSSRFFLIGKGLPFYYAVRALRAVFFGAQENLQYINWLVITAYNVVFGALAIWLIARRTHASGERARPKMIPAPMTAVGDCMLVAAGL